MLQKARGVEDVEIELHDIVEAARQSRLIRNPYISIWKRKYRPQLFVALIFMLFQQFDVSPDSPARGTTASSELAAQRKPVNPTPPLATSLPLQAVWRTRDMRIACILHHLSTAGDISGAVLTSALDNLPILMGTTVGMLT